MALVASSRIKMRGSASSARAKHTSWRWPPLSPPPASDAGMGRRLTLTPDQPAKLEPILAERQQKMQAVKADSTLTPDQRHKQLHAIGKSTRDEMAGVLTPDQMQQMKAMHKRHEAKQQSTAPTGA